MKLNIYDIAAKKETIKKSPLKAIREKCLDCCGYQHAEVKRCHLSECPLWPYRMGENPYRKRSMTEEQKREFKERMKKQKE